MSMFKELYPMALGATLTLTISADEKQGRMTVNVIPKPKPDAGEPALCAPLSLTATPEEFDAEFVEILIRYRTARASLAEQAQTTQEVLNAAKAASAKKGTTAVAKASTRTPAQPAATHAASAGEDGDDDEGDDNAGASDRSADKTASPVVPTAEAASPEPQLFG